MEKSEKELLLKAIKAQGKKIKELQNDYKELLDIVTLISNKTLDKGWDKA